MTYGDKRDYRKIELFVDGAYVATTTWARTCKEAVQKYIEMHDERNLRLETGKITARFG